MPLIGTTHHSRLASSALARPLSIVVCAFLSLSASPPPLSSLCHCQSCVDWYDEEGDLGEEEDFERTHLARGLRLGPCTRCPPSDSLCGAHSEPVAPRPAVDASAIEDVPSWRVPWLHDSVTLVLENGALVLLLPLEACVISRHHTCRSLAQASTTAFGSSTPARIGVGRDFRLQPLRPTHQTRYTASAVLWALLKPLSIPSRRLFASGSRCPPRVSFGSRASSSCCSSRACAGRGLRAPWISTGSQSSWSVARLRTRSPPPATSPICRRVRRPNARDSMKGSAASSSRRCSATRSTCRTTCCHSSRPPAPGTARAFGIIANSVSVRSLVRRPPPAATLDLRAVVCLWLSDCELWLRAGCWWARRTSGTWCRSRRSRASASSTSATSKTTRRSCRRRAATRAHREPSSPSAVRLTTWTRISLGPILLLLSFSRETCELFALLLAVYLHTGPVGHVCGVHSALCTCAYARNEHTKKKLTRRTGGEKRVASGVHWCAESESKQRAVSVHLDSRTSRDWGWWSDERSAMTTAQNRIGQS